MYIILRSVLLLILLISLTGASTIQGPIPTPNLPVVLTDGSSITVAPPYAGQETTFTLTITGASHTLQNPSTLLAGQFLHFIITQNGTGGFTPLWDTHYTFPYGAVSYNLAASAISVVSCVATTTSNLDCVSGTSSPSGGNPTATIGTSAVNGSSGNFMRADGAPAIPQCSSSTFGACKVDNSTITAASGVISTPGGANPTAAIGTAAVNGTATTFMRSDGAPAPAHVPTQQRFITGSSATYTTPANARELQITACGGGGGGGGSGSSAGSNATGGGNTTFNSVVATGGGFNNNVTGTTAGAGGTGGTGGTGSATWRVAGQTGLTGVGAQISMGPPGGLSGLGGILGQGGQGSISASTSRATGAAGGGGECFTLFIITPSGTYTYTVGTAGGAGSGGGTGAANGTAGQTGYIIIDEFY